MTSSSVRSLCRGVTPIAAQGGPTARCKAPTDHADGAGLQNHAHRHDAHRRPAWRSCRLCGASCEAGLRSSTAICRLANSCCSSCMQHVCAVRTRTPSHMTKHPEPGCMQCSQAHAVARQPLPGCPDLPCPGRVVRAASQTTSATGRHESGLVRPGGLPGRHMPSRAAPGWAAHAAGGAARRSSQHSPGQQARGAVAYARSPPPARPTPPTTWDRRRRSHRLHLNTRARRSSTCPLQQPFHCVHPGSIQQLRSGRARPCVWQAPSAAAALLWPVTTAAAWLMSLKAASAPVQRHLSGCTCCARRRNWRRTLCSLAPSSKSSTWDAALTGSDRVTTARAA